MDDLINRQVVLRDLEEYIVKPENAISVHPDDLHNYNSGLLTAIQAVTDIPSALTTDIIEVEQVTSVIARLRSNRESNLIRYTSNEGKESYVIRSQKDRGYLQALDDVEKLLLGRKEERK